MPKYDPYDDGSQNGETFPSLREEQELTPELTIVVLHDLEVKVADVLNAYVIATNGEKIWAISLGMMLVSLPLLSEYSMGSIVQVHHS